MAVNRSVSAAMTVIVAAALLALPALGAAQQQLKLTPDTKIQETPTTVDTLTVTGNAVPIPRVGAGAPLFTPGEILEIREVARRTSSDASGDANLCRTGRGNEPDTGVGVPTFEGLYRTLYEAANKVVGRGDAASEATAAATKARVDAGKGEATMRQVEDAELVRQMAVRSFAEARVEVILAQASIRDLEELMRDGSDQGTWRSEMSIRNVSRMAVNGLEGVALAEQFRDLRLVNIQVMERSNSAGPYLFVSGEIQNPRTRPVAVPPLSITPLDHAGFALKTEVTDPKGAGRIAAGGNIRFSYEFHPKPERAKTVVVTFAGMAQHPVAFGAAAFCTGPPEPASPE